MNLVILQGRLVRETELKENSVYKNCIAVDRFKKGESDFINIVSFGKTAEFMANYTAKGGRITIEGRIQVSSYEKEGKKVYSTDVIVNRCFPIDWRDKDKKKDDEIPAGFYPSEEDDEELPF